MQIYKKKWRNKRVRFFKFSSLILVFWFGLLGCYKKQDTMLQVYVQNSNGTMQSGALVKVFAEPTDTSSQNPLAINYTGLSNENGIATFNLNKLYQPGQVGVAIVKVKATYFNMTGESIEQIVEEVDNKCNIKIW